MPPVGEADSNTPKFGLRTFRLGAWQPLTGSGLAAFARAGSGRVLLFQFAFALLSALTVVWSLQAAWFPVIERAILQLPNSGAEIRGQRLLWPDAEAVLLASSPHLALVVDPTSSSQLGQNGDLQVELRGTDLRFRGLLGQIVARYPTQLLLPLDQTGAKAAWGAWRPPILTLVGLGTGMGLVLSGWILATLYAPVLLVSGWIIRRELHWGEAWKLGLACLMPGSLVMNAALVLYAQHWLGLTSLTALFGLHFLVGWLAALWGLASLPSRAAAQIESNPFENETMPVRSLAPTKSRNPFGS